MKPIPKSMLIHSATAIIESEPDTWGNTAETGRTELSFVRLEPSNALRIDKQNEQRQLSATLIYDCVNSHPIRFDFRTANKIFAFGETYEILRVEYLYDGRKLHHIEVELCQ